VSDGLFDPAEFAVPQPSREPGLSADRKRTVRRQELLDQGIHPATRCALREGDETCYSCVHAVKSWKWWKCDRLPFTGGPGTDIRVSWRACVKWEPRSACERDAEKGEG